jgi:hypothetical protein
MRRYILRDTTCCPKFLFAEIEEKTYQAELALLDRYQTFSAEILRIALLGLAAFGYLFKEMLLKIDWKQASCLPRVSKVLMSFSIAMFGVSAACALAHRFFSTEAARFFFYALRLEKSFAKSEDQALDEEARCERDGWLQRRKIRLTWSEYLKMVAAGTLGLSSSLLAAAFIGLLFVESWQWLPSK